MTERHEYNLARHATRVTPESGQFHTHYVLPVTHHAKLQDYIEVSLPCKGLIEKDMEKSVNGGPRP